jgi:hypothetical protein
MCYIYSGAETGTPLPCYQYVVDKAIVMFGSGVCKGTGWTVGVDIGLACQYRREKAGLVLEIRAYKVLGDRVMRCFIRYCLTPTPFHLMDLHMAFSHLLPAFSASRPLTILCAGQCFLS